MSSMLRNVMDSVFHPTEQSDERNTRALYNTIELESGHHIKIPTHEQIDNYIKQHAWSPYVGTAAKTGEDILSQVMEAGPVDALATVGGRIGTGVLRYAAQHLGAMGAGNAFNFLKPGAQHLENAFKDVFGIRRDLDKAGFTTQGKRARIGVENSELAAQQAREHEFKKAAENTDSSIHTFLQHMATHGDRNTSRLAQAYQGLFKKHGMETIMDPEHPEFKNQLAELIQGYNGAKPGQGSLKRDIDRGIDNILSMSPEERLEFFHKLNNETTDKNIKQITQRLFSNDAGLFKGTQEDLDKVTHVDQRNVARFAKSNPLNRLGLRNAAKQAIIWDPLTHGFKNVGQMAYMAGGLPAVLRGIYHMVKGVPPEVEQRLESMGAMAPNYAEKGKSGIKGHIEDFAHRLEAGWRAGLADTLEQKLGPPKTEAEKYIRGWMINDHIGDYRNQSAFVKFFEGLGGPFVAFRLGIVPQNAVRTLKEHPQRLAELYRAQQDLNENRQGKRTNTFEVGGPFKDIAEYVSDPYKFMQESMSGELTGEDFRNMGMSLMSNYVPGAGAVGDEANILSGTNRPGQDTTLQDKLFDSVASFFGMRYNRKKTAKQENLKYKDIQRSY